MDLEGPAFKAFAAWRGQWAAQDCARSPGPIQVRSRAVGRQLGGCRAPSKGLRDVEAEGEKAPSASPFDDPAPVANPHLLTDLLTHVLQFDSSSFGDVACISLALERNNGVPILLKGVPSGDAGAARREE